MMIPELAALGASAGALALLAFLNPIPDPVPFPKLKEFEDGDRVSARVAKIQDVLLETLLLKEAAEEKVDVLAVRVASLASTNSKLGQRADGLEEAIEALGLLDLPKAAHAIVDPILAALAERRGQNDDGDDGAGRTYGPGRR